MSIKKILKDANRYDDIINVLNSIASLKGGDIPVSPHINIKGGNLICHVNALYVSKEAPKLIKLINNEVMEENLCNLYEFVNLHYYVDSKTKDIIYDNALALSYGNNPKDNMNVIKIWFILSNLIININNYNNWSIPDGWKNL